MAKSKGARPRAKGDPAKADPAKNAAPPGAGKDAPPPADVEKIRHGLMAKMHTLMGLHRACPLRVCRRGRRCSGVEFPCRRNVRERRVTEEQVARTMAALYRAVRRRLEGDAATGNDDG